MGRCKSSPPIEVKSRTKLLIRLVLSFAKLFLGLTPGRAPDIPVMGMCLGCYSMRIKESVLTWTSTLL